MSRLIPVLVVLHCALSPLVASAATLTVDGNLSDWGFSIADNNASTFVPDGGLTILGMFTEDQDDLADGNGFLGPDTGGQAYDAEALAVASQGGSLFIALVTGQRPDNGFEYYAPGDIRIQTSGGVYGIEVGGGAGDGSGKALLAGAFGSTYAVDGHGFTTAHSKTAAAQKVGSTWLNPAWILDPIPTPEEVQFQIGGGGTHVGDAAFVFTRNSFTTQHANIELSLPLSLFNGETIQLIQWFPSCGNDELIVSGSFSTVVPEPSTALLLAVGGIGCAIVLGRRRGRAMRFAQT